MVWKLKFVWDTHDVFEIEMSEGIVLKFGRVLLVRFLEKKGFRKVNLFYNIERE